MMKNPLFQPIDDVLTLRKKTGLNQQAFWQNVGITQSGGSRYEHGRRNPAQVTALLRLVYLDKTQPSSIAAYYNGDNIIETLFAPVDDSRKLRHETGLNQTDFWTSIATTQSAGSRYESGRRTPKAVNALLRLAYIDGTLRLQE